MNIEELDLNGGTFKATFPYHWIGWLVWVVGLLITLFGFMLALSDTVTLLIAAIGLVVMSMATPGSLQGAATRLDRMQSIQLSYKQKQMLAVFQLTIGGCNKHPMCQQTTQATGSYQHLDQQHGIIQTDMGHMEMVLHYPSTQ